MIEAAEARRPHRAGPHDDRRGDLGQHRHRARLLCAAKGYELAIFLPQGMWREREALLRLYGARVEIVESLGGMDEAVQAARAPARDGDVFLPDQFSNPANPEAHRLGTGPEILKALDGKRRHLRRRRRDRRDDHRRRRGDQGANPRRRSSRSSQPLAVLSGARPRPAPHPGHRRRLRPRGARSRDHRRGYAVSDDDAIATAHLAAAREGVLAGISCGAALWGAIAGRQAPRVPRQADRHRPARLRRALHLGAVLRAAVRAQAPTGLRGERVGLAQAHASIAGHGPYRPRR